MGYTLFKHEQHGWKKETLRACGIALLAACASSAWAAPEMAVADAAPQGQVAPASADPVKPAGDAIAQVQDAPVRSTLDFGAPADLGKLEQSRGGTDVHNDMKLDGMVAGNSAINVVTGANNIDTGAFANMSGIPVVIQNSGANVLIQSATIVNLQFK